MKIKEEDDKSIDDSNLTIENEDVVNMETCPGKSKLSRKDKDLKNKNDTTKVSASSAKKSINSMEDEKIVPMAKITEEADEMENVVKE